MWRELMMPTKFKRTFSEAQRQEIVNEVLESGSNILIARKYDINPVQLSHWVSNFRRYNQTLKPKELNEEEIIPNYKKAYKKVQKELEEKELELAVLRDLFKKTQL